MTNRILPPGHGPADDFDAPEADALDRRIAEAARDYHRPPAQVPRDAMWEAIVATRAGRSAAPMGAAAPLAAETPVVSLDAARAARRAPAPQFTRTSWSTRWSLAAAASLLLVAGIGVGRWWEGRAQVGTTGPAVAAVGVAPSGAATPARDTATPDVAARPPMLAEATIDEPSATLDPAD
ncbi:MAG: hypothetical protein ACXWZ7_17875, partial [Gemmatirosa sp.]